MAGLTERSSRGAALGLIVNPLAGLGGPLAEKGSDAPGVAARAHDRELTAQVRDRAARAIAAFRAESDACVLTGPGPLGAEICPDGDIVWPGPAIGTAEDTRALVRAMQGRVGLILFVGGDGTARDVAGANAAAHPILGVPAGVKMQSGIFARSPERAGRMAAAFLADPDRRTDLVEIVDIDEAARRAGRLSARLYTTARAPAAAAGQRQGAKAAGGDLLADMDAAIARYVAAMEPGTAYILGPGTTMAALKDRLGGGTLLGVDVALGGRIVARDVDAVDLAPFAAGSARIVLTVVGGQGFVLGRGNQQISAGIVRTVGPDGIDVICDAGKLAGLRPPELTVDTGDPGLDALLAGYRQIITGPGRRQVMRVVN